MFYVVIKTIQSVSYYLFHYALHVITPVRVTESDGKKVVRTKEPLMIIPVSMGRDIK